MFCNCLLKSIMVLDNSRKYCTVYSSIVIIINVYNFSSISLFVFLENISNSNYLMNYI